MQGGAGLQTQTTGLTMVVVKDQNSFTFRHCCDWIIDENA